MATSGPFHCHLKQQSSRPPKVIILQLDTAAYAFQNCIAKENGVLLQYIYEFLRCMGWFFSPSPKMGFLLLSRQISVMYFYLFPVFVWMDNLV